VPAEALAQRISPLPESPHAAAAMERLREAADAQGANSALDDLLSDGKLSAFLGNVLGDCPYLLDLAAKNVFRLATIVADTPETRVARIAGEIAAAEWSARADATAALRIAKQDVALTLGLADLAGAIDLEKVTAPLTTFADAALGAALRSVLADAARAGKWTGGTEPRGLFILGMGKYGAGELNYSSDIDIIALFDPEAPGVVSGDPSTFWVGIMRKLVPLMQERTKDGYVFRTDLRLRPDPAATRIAISAPAALQYYESMGQNWERAALIKARSVAGDIAAGEAFIGELAPFIWRKYLDFAAIADIHSIKRQVHAHRGHGTVAVLGHDIKRGRGGIREIEFFVQTQQLIAGGRDPSLRGTETRAMLRKLTEKGWIDEAARAELDHAYVVLRNVEHRLQMVRDEQTHQLPRDNAELARIGRLMRNADPDAFEAELRTILETVARRYSELFESAEELSGAGSLVFTGGEDDPETLETLKKLGFDRPELVTETVRGWHFGRFAAMRSTAARENLTEITPALLQAFSRAGNPDAAVRAFDNLLKALPAGAQLFALLRNNPDLLDLLATVLSAAPTLAEVFARRPHVADALLDPSRLAGVDTLDAVREALERSLAEARRYEDVLDRARLFVAERKFLISVGLLNGVIAPADAGKAFSDLAEAVVAALFRHTRREFALKHGRLPGEQAAIIGFGRLGSREMTASSDLDLIIVYDHAPDAVSDGARPLPPSQYFSRLTQRLIAALSAPTGEGIAYEVDLRLRPSGRAGPLATNISGFESYQLTEAWTWEHMAMSRGRAIAGDSGLMHQVSGVLDALVGKTRDPQKLAGEVASMRARIEREKAAANVFDVKLAKGGLIDCEFAAQFLVLAGLGRVAGDTTLETLERAAGEGRIAPDLGERLVLSSVLQGALLQILRVSYPKGFSPEAAPEAEKRLMVEVSDTALKNSGTGAERAGVGSFAELEARLIEVQRQTRAALEEVLGVGVA
jgi:[glutamine synthetase] adenylyltransferase / [glutamine synthetase]-adenylyl-L-tyrosine phosphorylase